MLLQELRKQKWYVGEAECIPKFFWTTTTVPPCYIYITHKNDRWNVSEIIFVGQYGSYRWIGEFSPKIWRSVYSARRTDVAFKLWILQTFIALQGVSKKWVQVFVDTPLINCSVYRGEHPVQSSILLIKTHSVILTRSWPQKQFDKIVLFSFLSLCYVWNLLCFIMIIIM